MAKPINENVKKIIQDLGEKGFTTNEIGSILGITAATVKGHIKKYNIPYNCKKKENTLNKNYELYIQRSEIRCINRAKDNFDSLKTAYNYRKEWTPEEEQKLIELYKSGKNHKEIALEMGRSVFAISAKIRDMKIGRKLSYLTDEEKKFIEENYKTMTKAEIARTLNVEYHKVNCYIARKFKD